MTTARTHTKTIDIGASFDKVFAFLAHAPNWPAWAIVNVKSIGAENDGWWEMSTPLGSAQLRIRPNKQFGILDHDFHGADASWTVPARLVKNGDGCSFLITFFQPPSFTASFFDQQMALIDQEMTQLKTLMKAE